MYLQGFQDLYDWNIAAHRDTSVLSGTSYLPITDLKFSDQFTFSS